MKHKLNDSSQNFEKAGFVSKYWDGIEYSMAVAMSAISISTAASSVMSGQPTCFVEERSVSSSDLSQ
jgi:hypothetical protein